MIALSFFAVTDRQLILHGRFLRDSTTPGDEGIYGNFRTPLQYRTLLHEVQGSREVIFRSMKVDPYGMEGR